MDTSHHVSIREVAARPFAAVRARMPVADVPSRCTHYLNQVYDAARGGLVALDGQNIFTYRDTRDAIGNHEVDVEFGVGATAPFEPVGEIGYSSTPGGLVATATHWGDYSGIRGAHQSVVRWCRANGHSLTGFRWEVYGHWSEDPAKIYTEVYYLIGPSPNK